MLLNTPNKQDKDGNLNIKIEMIVHKKPPLDALEAFGFNIGFVPVISSLVRMMFFCHIATDDEVSWMWSRTSFVARRSWLNFNTPSKRDGTIGAPEGSQEIILMCPHLTFSASFVHG